MQGTGGAGSAQAPAACTLLLVAPHHRTHSLPSTPLLSQDLLDTLQQRMGTGSVPCLETLSASLQSYTSFCASPPHCWLCSLVPNEHSSVFQSGCGLLSTATTQRAGRQSTERSFPFLQHHSSGKKRSQDRSGLLNPCSCPGLSSAQGQHSIKSPE